MVMGVKSPAGIGVRVIDAARRIATLHRCGGGGGAVPMEMKAHGETFVVLVCRKQDFGFWAAKAAELAVRGDAKAGDDRAADGRDGEGT